MKTKTKTKTKTRTITKTITLLLAVILSVCLVPTFGAAAQAEQLPSTHGELVLEKVDTSLSFVQRLLQALKNFFNSIKYTFDRMSGKSVTVNADSISDFDLAENGETVKLAADITSPDVQIEKAVNIDLNGHVIKCNSFTYETYNDADVSIGNGIINACGGGNVEINVPEGTVNLAELKVKLSNQDSKFIVNASMNTLNIEKNVIVVYGDNSEAPIIIPADTRVVIDNSVATKVNIVLAGSNTVIENESVKVQKDTFADGTENPDAGKSVVAVSVANAGVSNVVITNKATTVKAAPVIAITVPNDYKECINVVDADGFSGTVVDVKTTDGEDGQITMNGKHTPIKALECTLSENTLTAIISGLNADTAYEYRPCYSQEYTAVEAGASVFATNEKHIFVRKAATEGFEAGDEYEIETGVFKTIPYTIADEKDFTLAQDGETIKLTSDISCSEFVLDKAISLILDGHTISCDNFVYKASMDIDTTISGGVINAKTAEIGLTDGTVTINGLHADKLFVLSGGVKIGQDVIVSDITATDNTSVIITVNVTAKTIINVAGSNVLVENESYESQESELYNKSIVEVVISDLTVNGVSVSNKTYGPAGTVIPVIVPNGYKNFINIIYDATSQIMGVDVKSAMGEAGKYIVNGKLLPIESIECSLSEDGLTATIAGLDAGTAYEYRPCYSQEYTAVDTGATSFTTSDKHIFVRKAAVSGAEACDDYEIETGVQDKAKEYNIGCVKELSAFRDAVNAGNNFKGVTVNLLGDIDLNGISWYHIGYSSRNFAGTFDGKCHTISNLNVMGASMNDNGLFGSASLATIKNLNIHNAYVPGYLHVGVLVGYCNSGKATIDNVHITGVVNVSAYWYAGALVGQGYCSISNSSIEVKPGSKIEVSGGYAGGFIGHCGEGSWTILDNCLSDIDVYGQYNGIGGLTGIAQYGNKIINCSCSGDVINTTADEGEECPTGGICGSFTQAGSTVASITNCTYTGTLYHNSEVHENMAHPLFGSAYPGATTIIIDGKEVKP